MRHNLRFLTTGLAAGIALSGALALAQTNPTPFELATGDFAFTAWAASESAGTFPANMVFHTYAASQIESATTSADPSLFAPNGDYALAYNLGSGSRINGLGTDGIMFTNTGTSTQGQAVVALDTTGRENVQVSWTAGTVTPNNRVYAIRLQYRVGTTGTWADPAGAESTFTYLRSATAGDSQTFGPVTLPAAANNESVVQVRWIYYQHASNAATGTRAALRLDDITITAAAAGSASLIAAPLTLGFPNTQVGGASASQVITLNGSNLTPSISTITVAAPPAGFETSLDDVAFGTAPLVINYGDGEVEGAEVFVRFAPSALGAATGTLNIAGGTGTAEVELSGTAESGLALSTSTVAFGPATRNQASDPINVTVTGLNLVPAAGNVALGVTGANYEISLNGSDWFTSPVLVNYTGGELSQAVQVRTTPTVLGNVAAATLEAAGGSAADVSAALTAVGYPGINEIVVPAFMQGSDGTNDNRTPVAFLVELTELDANTTYRSLTRVVTPGTPFDTNGPGNAIAIDRATEAFAYTTSQGLGSNFSSFTTDANGAYTGWFIAVPSSNAGFATGNTVQFQLILNNAGVNDTAILVRPRVTTTTQVIDYGAPAPNTGAALLTTGTIHQGKTFAVLYSDEAGATQPLAAAAIEDTEAIATVPSNFPAFYNQVNGVDGSFGVIIPSDLPTGVRRVEIRDIAGNILESFTSASGVWDSGVDTVNPTGIVALEPSDLQAAPSSVSEWQSLLD